MTQPPRPGTVVAAGIAVALVLWGVHLALSGGATGLFRDGGVYLVTAQELAERATYAQASLPGAPPAVRYPPMLPLALSIGWCIAPDFPANLPLLKSVSAAGGVLLALLLPPYLRRLGFSRWVAAETAVLTVLSPLTLRYATTVASELPFAALAIAALWTLDVASERSARVPAAVWAGVLAGLACLTRVVGVAVVIAGVIALWPRGRGRTAAFLVGAAVCVGPWLAWLVTQPAGGDMSYLAAYASDGPPSLGQLLEHALELPAAAALVALPGVVDVLPVEASTAVLSVLYLLGGGALLLTLGYRFAPYVVVSLLVALAAPWFQPRFLVPVAPLLLAALLGAVFQLAPRVLGTAAVGALLAATLLGQQARLEAVQASGLPALEDLPEANLTWSELDQALQWLRTSSAEDEVVGALHDQLVYLYTGRRAVRAYPSLWRPDPAQVGEQLARARARYLVDFPSPDTGAWREARDAFEQWVAEHEEDLEPAYTSPDGHIRIWRLADDARLAVRAAR